MDIIGRSYMIITSENERVNWFSEQGNLIVIRKKEQERERERGGERRKCIFMQEKHLLFRMSACTNSRGNANGSLGKCQYLSYYTLYYTIIFWVMSASPAFPIFEIQIEERISPKMQFF